MLDIKYIRENKDAVKKNCELRNIACDVDRILELDGERKDLIEKIEGFRKGKNEINEQMKNIANISAEEKKEILMRASAIKLNLEQLEPKFEEINKQFQELILGIPNMTHPDSPIGKDDGENKEIERYGEPPKLDFVPKGHEELMNDLDLIDFERGAKVAGAKFYFLKNEAVLLEQALINFAFQKLIKKGFILFSTPDIAKDKVLFGTGYNPRGPEQQIYSIENTDLSLIATSEIPMGGYHMNEVIEEKDLPLKYAAISHCYRVEAGSYGRHSAGLYRVHQFTKVEMFVYAAPEFSEAIHTELKNIEVEIFKDLGVPFRVVDICTGDLGGPACRKYDLEAWMTSRNDWGEVTSTSDTTDYQARRLNIKIKRENGKKEFLHMLNGTAIAISRALIAIIENGQLVDGSVMIPEVLQKYMPGGQKAIKPKK
ncbi:MAG: serine--tRNA ligase [Parcubacteria group bacterium]|jgi:seryl-tRNA synthetase